MKRLLMVLLAWSGTLQAAEDLKIKFDEKGLASIVHNGVVLVNPADERFMVQGVAFTDSLEKNGVRRMWQPKPTKSAFDAATKTLLQEYDWGKTACVFTAKENRLDLRITLTNASGQPIQGCTLCPLRMILPNRYFNRFVSYYQEGDQSVPCHLYTHEKGSVALINPDHGTGSTALFGDRGGKFQSVSLILSGPTEERVPHHPIVDDVYFPKTGRLVAPGQTDTYRLSLVFGAPDAKIEPLSAQTDAEYARAHPMTLKWPDRRPIATVFLCNSAWGLPKNPRGWFQGDRDVDVTTSEGLEKFGAKLMAYAGNCVARMKKMNAQGVIVWDIEGEEMPHAISYIGDPRTLPKTAPEMDRFADAFMKKFSDAGFKLGVTIRPTEVYQPGVAGKLAWDHRLVRDPVALMSAKITYAQKRWGCTIFYLDSNVFGNDMMTEEQRKELRFIPWIMPATMLGKLAVLHPDCLIIPEWSEKIDYAFSAPYSSANLGQGGTPADIRRIWPTAFRVVSLNLPLLEDRWQSYAESVEKGDVLLFPPWFDAQENSIVQILYREAALRKSDTYQALSKADLGTLLKKTADPDEGTRYAAASALGVRGKPEAIPALIGLLEDDSPLVRKQTLVALGQMPKISDPACIATLTERLKPAKDPMQNALRTFAADALARAGDAAVPALLDLLAPDKPQNRPAWPYAIRALGRSGTTNPRAGAVLLGFLDGTPQKVEYRSRSIEALGLLKARDAVPVLVEILKKRDRESEEERKLAVIALGRIGDPSALGPLVEQFNVGYSTVVVYWIKGGIEEALRAITAAQDVVGREEWLAWWKKKLNAEKAKQTR